MSSEEQVPLEDLDASKDITYQSFKIFETRKSN
jgi:hypothetical protein